MNFRDILKMQIHSVYSFNNRQEILKSNDDKREIILIYLGIQDYKTLFKKIIHSYFIFYISFLKNFRFKWNYTHLLTVKLTDLGVSS